MADPPPVILCLTAAGESLATGIAGPIGATVHGRAGRTRCDVTFDDTLGHVRTLFAAGHPVIGICAAGILIRAVAPLLADKHAEPPVIAVAEDGSAVVPLLGGHRGGNRIAWELAEILGISAAVTTAGDLSLGVAVDVPPPGWRLSNPEDAPAVMAALLSGAAAQLSGHEAGFLDPLVVAGRAVRSAKAGSQGRTWLQVEGAPSLDYRAQQITVGVGCARDCPSAELSDLVVRTLATGGIARAEIAGLFSLDLKADETAVLDLAAELDVPFRLFPATELEAETPRLANPSDTVFAEVGCHGVAEAAALAGAGPKAQLIVEKRKSANATVAIAKAPAPITTLPGRRRGRISLIGIGPGQAAWRTPEASRLITEANELVGYGLYLDLLGPLAAGKPRRDFPLGGEEERCRYALERAAEGCHIALVCSGDAGIYAMGALVYELIDRTEHGVSDAARRVEIVTTPGISAMQAAAARIGAPLGHDFCAISLSDLLTPRADIERRIRAAAEGDFVVAFYNPVSKRRRDLFVTAIETLRRHRPPETPVILASSLGRPEETLQVRQLNEISVNEVDMLTVVLVGASQSRTVRVGGPTRVYTPRGYAMKHRESAAS